MRRTGPVALLLMLVCMQQVARGAEPSTSVILICNHAGKLMAQKKDKQAVALLEQIFKRQPDFVLARKNLAIAYSNYAVQCGKPVEAVVYFHKATALNPEDTNLQLNLSFALQKANIDALSSDERVKYGDALKAQGDDVGAFVEYQLGLQGKNDASVQKKIDALVSPEDRATAGAVGGAGAKLLLSKIELDHGDDAAFKFEYDPYVRAIWRKIEGAWQAPASLGNRQVQVSFTTTTGGDIANLKLSRPSGDKTADSLALNAVKTAVPFTPLPSDIFFEVPVTVTLDAHMGQSPVYYLNGEAKPDGVRFSSGSEVAPLKVPKDVDAKLQARNDEYLSRASKSEKELTELEKRYGSNDVNLCPKLRAIAESYLQATQYKLAEEKLNRAIAIAQAAKADHEQALALSQLGALNYNINRNKEADSNLSEAMRLFEGADRKDIAGLRNTMEVYAKVLYRLNRVAEANQLYDKLKTSTIPR